MDTDQQLAGSGTEISRLTLLLKERDGEGSACDLFTLTVMAKKIVDELKMMKKMSRAKDFQISQLESLVKTSKGKLCVNGVSCDYGLTYMISRSQVSREAELE